MLVFLVVNKVISNHIANLVYFIISEFFSEVIEWVGK
jgi:hypothetical protein